MCLGHMVDSKVVRAYRRTDYPYQRRLLMERWAQHVTGAQAQVVAFRDGSPAAILSAGLKCSPGCMPWAWQRVNPC